MWTVSRKAKTVRWQSCWWTRDTDWIAAVFALKLQASGIARRRRADRKPKTLVADCLQSQ